MSIQRWDPFREMMTLREAMDRLFQESFIRPSSAGMASLEGGALAVDMYQTDNELVVKAPLPGVKPEDVEITITGDTLTIRGAIKAEQEIKRENYFRQERRFGSFARTLTLPLPVQAEKAEATFDNGLLTLTIPKAAEARPKQIKVSSKK